MHTQLITDLIRRQVHTVSCDYITVIQLSDQPFFMLNEYNVIICICMYVEMYVYDYIYEQVHMSVYTNELSNGLRVIRTSKHTYIHKHEPTN